MNRAFYIGLVVVAAVLIAMPADGAMGYFVLGGGAATVSEREELDDLLDPYTIRADRGSWEAGGGVRFFGRAPSEAGHLRWMNEMRLRATMGQGDLPGARFDGFRSDYSYRNRFAVSSRESFSYTRWAVGGFFSTTIQPTNRAAIGQGGFYLGPVIESYELEAERAWSGPTDCWECGPADDHATVRYGMIEAGLHYLAPVVPVRLEAFWVPGRAELSITQKVKSPIYTANFSSFARTFGARLVYDF